MTEEQIREVVRLYGVFEEGPRSKIFDNADFGYTKVTIERPLRLKYQMTTDAKARFLDAVPQLLDDLQAIDEEFGRDPFLDWSRHWKKIEKLLKKRSSRWTSYERKLFRSVFTQRDPAAEPVLKEGREEGFEADPELRDFENVPLKEDVEAYFKREVLPHVPDAWMDHSKDKVGYEINFNRHFYVFTLPRSLTVIDADLKSAEQDIVRLLREATT